MYGVLYQILGSLDWASKLTLQGMQRSDDLQEALLIFEPANGGDIEIVSAGERIVEQWKSRRSAKPWAIREVITKVLPNLLRSVQIDALDQPVSYRFVTEGRCPNWRLLQLLIRSMERLGLPGSPLLALDDSANSVAPFYGGTEQPLSPRAFFASVVSSLRAESKSFANLDDDAFARIAWHLLANFSLKAEVSADELRGRIDDFIAKHTGDPDHVIAMRERLCGHVLSLATVTGKSITPRAFFRMAELDEVSLTTWRSVFGRLNGETEERLRSILHFEPALNVRSLHNEAGDAPIVLVTGDQSARDTGSSGKGKSFTLGAIGHSSIGPSRLVVVMRASGRTGDVLKRVAEMIWKRGFERTSHLTLDSVAKVLRRECPDLPAQWLTVIVDDLQSQSEALELADFPWQHCGARLVAAVSIDAREAVAVEHSDHTTLIELSDFAVLELRDYLQRRGFAWGAVPLDYRELLRWPLLAQFYCDVATQDDSPDENEYALFHRVWQRIRKDPRQKAFVDDETNLRELVVASVNGLDYPWSLKSCREYGLHSDVIDRLVEIGWLERDEGRIQIRHYRLLNWAVAVALAHQFRTNPDIGLSTVATALAGTLDPPPILGKAPLQFLPMDILWLCCGEETGVPTQAHRVLEVIEDGDSRSDSDILFKHLLPTLGVRVVRPLAAFLSAKQPTQFATWIYLSAETLQLVGRRYPAVVREAAIEMVSDASIGVGACAANLLRDFPSPLALDGLWKLRKRYSEWKKGASAGDHSIPTGLSSDINEAVTECAALDLAWLSRSIGSSIGNADDLEVLADSLGRIEGKAADDVWWEHRKAVTGALGATSHALTRCLDRFADADGLTLAKEWIRSDSLNAQGNALQVFGFLNAETLYEELKNWKRGGTRIWYAPWISHLMEVDSQRMVATFTSLMERSEDDALFFGQRASPWLNRFGSAAVRVLIHATVSACQQYLKGDSDSTADRLNGFVALLAEISHPNLVAELHVLRGSQTEQELVEIGSRYVDEAMFPHPRLENLLAVLERIQGGGYAAVVNHMLASRSRSRRRDGLELAWRAPDAKTRELLKVISIDDGVSDGENPNLRPNIRILQDAALELLAELCEDAALAEAMSARECDVISLYDLRADGPPMEDEILAPYLTMAKSGTDEERIRALMTLGVSGRKDLATFLLEQECAAPIESKRSFAALCGLFGIGANNEVAIKVFARHLGVKGHGRVAGNGLLRANHAAAREAILAHLEAGFSMDFDSLDEQLAAILSRRADTRERALKVLRTHAVPADAFESVFQYRTPLDVFGELDDVHVHELLLQEANPKEAGFHVVGRRAAAIRGLAKRDSVEAFASACRALEHGKYDRELYPAIMVRLNARKAIPILFDQMINEDSELVRRGIGLALRKCKRRSTIRNRLRKWLREGNAMQRATAAEISGWVGDHGLCEDLFTAASNERLNEVRQSLAGALNRLERQVLMRTILEALSNQTPMQQWCSIEALLELDDAEFIGTSNDPLWIGPIFDRFSPLMRRRLNGRYQKKLEELKRGLQFRRRRM